MNDFIIFDKPLKVNWVKRLCLDFEDPWRYILVTLLPNAGGTHLLNCNYDYNLLNLSEDHPRHHSLLRPLATEIIVMT